MVPVSDDPDVTVQWATPASVQLLAPMDFSTDDNTVVVLTQINAVGRPKGYQVLSGQGSPELMQRLDPYGLLQHLPAGHYVRQAYGWAGGTVLAAHHGPRVVRLPLTPNFHLLPQLLRIVARTCSIGPRLVPARRQKPADLSNRSALRVLWCLLAATLMALLAPSPALSQSAGNVLLESNEQLFCVLAALNAAGYDAGMTWKPDGLTLAAPRPGIPPGRRTHPSCWSSKKFYEHIARNMIPAKTWRHNLPCSVGGISAGFPAYRPRRGSSPRRA